jgi:hypothetical protein
MSWSVTVTNSVESGTNIDESIEAAREYAKGLIVDEEIRPAVAAAIEAQLAYVRATVDAVGETRTASFEVYGHLSPDGSGNVGISGTLSSPVAATAPEGV